MRPFFLNLRFSRLWFGTLLLAAGLTPPGASAMEQRVWQFKVFLDDTEIGYHSFRVREDEHTTTLESQARLTVKLLFVDVYRYVHDNREVWRGNCLARLESTTNDNGKPYSVKGTQDRQQFVVETRENRFTLPSCPMSFAYWNPAILKERRLLNTQTGEYLEVEVEHTGEDDARVAGQWVKAQRYELKAGEMQIRLWYTEDAQWVQLESEVTGGRKLRYTLDSWPATLEPRPDQQAARRQAQS